MATATSPVTPKAPLKRAPPLSIFDQIRNDPKFSHRRSIDWFKTKINSLGGNSPSAKTDLLKTTKEKQSNIVLPGTMVLFKYDPINKDTLPFYDVWPLTLVISQQGNLMTGINFHYLPYALRARLFDKLWMIASDVRNSKEQVVRLNWKLLSSVSKFPEIRPAIKSYRLDHLQTKFIKIPILDWKTAIFLPFESFAKKSSGYVARDSGMKIRKLV
jgi:hypothetical protein